MSQAGLELTLWTRQILNLLSSLELQTFASSPVKKVLIQDSPHCKGEATETKPVGVRCLWRLGALTAAAPLALPQSMDGGYSASSNAWATQPSQPAVSTGLLNEVTHRLFCSGVGVSQGQEVSDHGGVFCPSWGALTGLDS